MTIKEALQQLDPTDEAQWTSDGLPLVEVVRGLTGKEVLTRKEITDADPEFCRDKATVQAQPPVSEAKPKTRDEELREEMSVLEREINEQSRIMHEIEAKITQKQDRWNRLHAYFSRKGTGDSDMEGRIAYIRKQAELRAERAQRSKRVLTDLDLRMVNPKAPIDQAMSRKNTRGTVRPNFTPDPQKE